jgi:hypothetical protein
MNDGKDVNGARERKVINHPHEPISVAIRRQGRRRVRAARSPERTSLV